MNTIWQCLGIVDLQCQETDACLATNPEANIRRQAGGGCILGPGVHDAAALTHCMVATVPDERI